MDVAILFLNTTLSHSPSVRIETICARKSSKQKNWKLVVNHEYERKRAGGTQTRCEKMIKESMFSRIIFSRYIGTDNSFTIANSQNPNKYNILSKKQNKTVCGCNYLGIEESGRNILPFLDEE